MNEILKIVSLVHRDDSGDNTLIDVRMENAGGKTVIMPIHVSGVNAPRLKWLNKGLVGKVLVKEPFPKPLAATEKRTYHDIIVTPYAALQFLSKNMPSQRPFIIEHIDRLATVMRNDQWVGTHQGFGFLADGQMYDGGNRSLAILLSGKSIVSDVTVGEKPSAIGGTDNQKPRAPLHSAIMEGQLPHDLMVKLPTWNLVQSAAKAIFYEARERKAASSTDLAQVVEHHRESFEAIAPYYRAGYSQTGKIRDGSVLAALVMGHSIYPEATLKLIEAVVADKHEGDSQDAPSRRLGYYLGQRRGRRNAPTKDAASKDLTPASRCIYKVLYAIEQTAKGKTTPSLQGRPSTLIPGLFPNRSAILGMPAAIDPGNEVLAATA